MLLKYLKYIIVIIFFISVGFNGRCSINNDSTKLKNSIYMELLGAGYYYSINYERIIIGKNNSSLNLRSGLNWHPFTPFYSGGSNYILGLHWHRNLNSKYQLSIGLNSIFWITYSPLPNGKEEKEIALNNPEQWGQPYYPFVQFSNNVSVSLRRQLLRNRFISISVNPHYFINYGLYTDSFIRFWGGISFGKSF